MSTVGSSEPCRTAPSPPTSTNCTPSSTSTSQICSGSNITSQVGWRTQLWPEECVPRAPWDAGAPPVRASDAPAPGSGQLHDDLRESALPVRDTWRAQHQRVLRLRPRVAVYNQLTSADSGTETDRVNCSKTTKAGSCGPALCPSGRDRLRPSAKRACDLRVRS